MSAIKVLIADDEVIIRKGIRTSIDWEPLGIEIVGEARNGQEALELAESLQPDIVMTDIRMPLMDGLALAAKLKEQKPHIKLVIVSGYDDFDYARQALKIGVSEYLTKPVGAGEMTKLMSKLSDQIRAERERHSEEWHNGMLLRESMPYIQGKWLNRLLKGEHQDEEMIRNRARQLHIALDGPEYAVVVIDIDDYRLIMEQSTDREKELIQFAIQNIAEELFGEKFTTAVCRTEEDTLAVLLSVNMSNKHLITACCEEMQQCVRRYVKLSVTLGIGSIISSLANVQASMEEAMSAIRSKVYRGKGQIIVFDAKEHAQMKSPMLIPTEEELELLQRLATMDFAGIRERLDKWFRHCAEEGVSYQHVQTLCVKLVVLATTHVEQMGVKRADLDPVLLNPYDEVKKYETAHDMKQWLLEMFESFVLTISQYKTSRYRNIVSVAIQYVQEHYAEELKLEDIAGHVYVTPNYFSRVFKQETGEHFTEWLNKFRVEKAKPLLRDVSLKVYEVAEQVGYNDYKYFAHIFKKYTGTTPKEYRNQL
ncbi:response regulator transcription factor [Paenibacillus apiarius]|uniref:Response regulator transcription factor n=1 Tax=Paenibacillus apiarius TaxID=46240 RepID=A0ABT4DYC9_9BACL|nr:response regulator transcription factor [Paenibacillus apiarius]MCY9512610.1 response regulator transcription factor [Paenibacillus apiarius]MCY9522367.1 response regulator transcription factor [Paenibacillus apiarius]MCY9553669.1 response regulator transcription factor [Paenibacillus apiarius]MCY9556612.1 response regulator transcription factor [Paenibacillus apiarius]MCY9682851.1 response regulator transcription factor [Paenibacillus apiarius]